MLPSLRFSILPIFGFFLLCTATEILPRAPHAALEPPGFFELQDVVVARRSDLDLRSALLPRKSHPASGIPANSSSALNKRQSTCDSGYGLCDATELCCPLDSSCCNDGSCAAGGETCCSGGGVCESGWACCGYYASCSPIDGECCADGSYCDAGLYCVLLDGVQGCCANLDCTSFDSGPAISLPPSITIPSFTPISITLPSITPIPSPSITHLSIPTLTVPASLTTEYIWYTTTLTWFYYSYFITYIAPASQRTSIRTSTTEIVSVYASNTADATSQFATLSSDLAFTTAVTAPGYTNSLASPTSSTSGVVAFTNGAKGVKTGFGGLGAAAIMGCLGVLTGLLMVWL